MATPIIMPKFGQMTEESAIVEWLKKEGDKVAKGDILFTVETDKSVMEVESFEAGTLLKIARASRASTCRCKARSVSSANPAKPIPEVIAPAPPAAPEPRRQARCPQRRLRSSALPRSEAPAATGSSASPPSLPPAVAPPPGLVPHQPARRPAGGRLRH